jgi:rSAM/selenodomain-associated transferase 2
METAAPMNRSGQSADWLSVVIPTLDEAKHIGPLLADVYRAGRVEAIVVDGGSRDATVAAARERGARVIETAPGRARQMNRGAAAARGRLLFFLHADSRLPRHYDDLVRRALAAPGVAAAAFRFRIDAPGTGLRFVEFWANLRSRYLHMPYGDQGLGIAAALFSELGGFPDLPIMEDFELIRRLRTRGRIAILPAALRTSPRRWQNLGAGRTTLINQAIVVAYLAGISPHILARFYRRSRGIG